MIDYEKGSEWRKWDLHIHTPCSIINKHGGNTEQVWEKFILSLEKLPSEVKVIGINDYYFIDGYEKVMSFKNNGRLQNIDKIFPVLEFRIDTFASATGSKFSKINIHIIFDLNESDLTNEIKQVREEFIGNIKLSKNHATEKLTLENLQKYATDSKLKTGFSEMIPNTDNLFETINSNQWKRKTFIVIGYNEWNNLEKFTQLKLEKKKLYSVANAFFTASETDDMSKKEEVLGFISDTKENKALLHSGDIHNFYPLGIDTNYKCFTWIKADPTFEGLKQIIYEPEERVYIGEQPSILNKVENNKTNYLKSLEINQANLTHTGDTWFENISISFNKELIAIIGNKGSGKSGIADILGLVGDTHTDKKHFSFLHDDKFLKEKLADKFKAKIVWESGGESEEVLLSDNPNTKNPESVRFIPQNYFEELTNEIEISEFQHVLENIIFEYIPNDEKFNEPSFKALKEYKTENVNTAIQEKKNKIQNINKDIIDLEKKKHPDYLKTIEGLISQKKIEIKEQKKLLEESPTIINPNDNSQGSEQQSDNIAIHNKELDSLKISLKEKEKNRSDLTNKLEAVTQFRRKIELQQQSINEFLQNHTEEATKYTLNISDILKIVVDYSSVDKKIKDYKAELEGKNIFFESVDSIQTRRAESDNKSIIYKINVLTNQLKTETDKLTGEEKAYQKNEQRKKSIKEKIQELTGDNKNSENGTLNFHQKEKAFINNKLVELLKDKRNARVKLSLEIFNKKTEVIKLYDSFKGSVDKKIIQNKDLIEDYDIKIESSFNFNSSFYSDFLAYINQRKSGCFLGAEKGEIKIKSIVEDSGFSDENKIKNLLTNIIDSLEQNNAEISEQVNDDKLNSFYDYVFSLDYLSPKYELKLGGKVLSQLSPGERGALLLIFYLMIDKEKIPLVIDQPEDNLDNESVYNMLSKFIKQAKKKRQIIMVTHNPNLAVGADAEQIIRVSIDKTDKNKFSFISGSIENPEINKKIVQILEGTKPAFDKRKLKYQGNNS